MLQYRQGLYCNGIVTIRQSFTEMKIVMGEYEMLSNVRIGVGMTGSFCTFEKSFQTIQALKEKGAVITPIFSGKTQDVSCRFGDTKEFMERIETITGKTPMCSIEEAESVGPGRLFDVFLLMPCTGNTLAKLANGITDTPVLMGAKAHLRNNLPLVIFISTNDGLGMNLKNIGILLPSKHIFFVPFGQDNPLKKPNSLVAYPQLVEETILEALEGRQIQPVLR